MPCCRVEAGRSDTRTTHREEVQDTALLWREDIAAPVEGDAHRAQRIPEGVAQEEVQETAPGLELRSMGQLAGQGVPSGHCQEAPDGSAKTRSANARSHPNHLRFR